MIRSRLARAGARTALAALFGSASVAAWQAQAPAAARVIAGRIVNDDGTPRSGATVEALIARIDSGAETVATAAAVITDRDGRFELRDLPPGTYYVAASDAAARSAPTYYPGVPFADQAKAIPLDGRRAPGSIEFRFKPFAPVRVSGLLLTEDGRPLLNAAIVLHARAAEGLPIVSGDPSLMPDGRFVFERVVPGRYEIRGRGQTDAAGIVLFGAASIDVLTADVEDVRVTLKPGAEIDGRVSVASGVRTKPPAFSALRVRAPFTDGTRFGDALTGAVRADGTFALRGLMPGAHQFVVEGLPAPWVVKGIVYRGSDITDRQVDVRERQPFRDLRVTITDQSSLVGGVVRNGAGAAEPQATVLVFSRVPLFWTRTNRRMRAARTDAEGRFAIAGLPTGEYFAIASAAGDETDLGRPERLRALEPIATPLTVATDDARLDIALRLAGSPEPGAGGRR